MLPTSNLPIITVLLLAGCAGPRMQRLVFEPHPSDMAIDSACRPADEGVTPTPETAACEVQREVGQSWRPQPALGGDDTVRLVLTGDAGIRRADDRTQVAAGPLAVSKAAQAACGGTCDGAVFLGDNLYTNGVQGADDTAWLGNFVDAWSWAGDLRFVLGNHDWGPVAYGDYEAPERDRAQRMFRDLVALDAAREVTVGGDAHFWQAESGPLSLVALDTNFVVRRCNTRMGARGIRCKGDPGVRERDFTPLQAAAHSLITSELPWTIVVGHHPWRSNGHHGDVGHYRDQGLPLWRGRALRRLFDEEVRGQAPLYLSGHDHNTQVHLDPDGTASVVVGAGGKTSGPGPQGERRRSEMAVESYCTLGFAIVEASAETLAVEVHRITAAYDKATEDGYAECATEIERNRPELKVGGPGCTRFQRGVDGPWQQTACVPTMNSAIDDEAG
ncbi:MAG: tartrate-resistant acid phosphatase type 5 [Myxococcota bacterium]|jgi:tartrate-resistant acid phosphatase type 5